MLAITRPNLNNILNDKLPSHLISKTEDISEKTVSLVIYYMRRDNKLVQLVDVSNGDILQEIVIDNAYDENILLSSDGKFLTYNDDNNNIVYYDIYNKTKKVIKLTFNRCYYFDRNGLYLIMNEDDTTIFDIKNNKIKYILPFKSVYNIISQDYNKLYSRSDNYIKLYDFNNGSEIYSIELNNDIYYSYNLSRMSLTGDFIYYTYNNCIKIININNNLEYTYTHDMTDYHNDDIKLDDILASIAFHPNNKIVILHFKTYILVIDIIQNKIINKLENITFDDNDRYNNDSEYYEMEFQSCNKHEQYLIVKINNYYIQRINIYNKN